MYYFQFTITAYGKDIEPNIPDKYETIIPAFQRLSNRIGPDRMIWRYDPILISEWYTLHEHIQTFDRIALKLHRYTRRVTISFIDEEYRGVKSNMKALELLPFPTEAQIELSSRLAEIARGYGLTIDTCAEQIDLQQFGIEHAHCIDPGLFERLLGCHLNIEKDKTQRPACGCATSIDIGMYNTCSNGCRYCYANYVKNVVATNFANYNPHSPLISGNVNADDKITNRAMKKHFDAQMSLLDLQ
jgi:hypothetical protein